MKKLAFMIVLLTTLGAKAQISGSITVGGDFDKFYPTVWNDGGWDNNVPAQIEIGRSDTHLSGDWRGTVMAKFTFHTSRWGHGAQFITADIIQTHNTLYGQNRDFIASWKDATGNNSTGDVVIWLRGGSTTYYYKSLYSTTCRIYDGVSNPLPFQEVGGPTLTFKTAADPYVNSNGLTKDGNVYFQGGATNYFAGNIGVGTYDTKGYKLAVAGNMIAESVKVQLQGSWADYVFDDDYKLQPLSEIEAFVKKNKHLPEIPSAEAAKTHGIDLEDMNAKLLKKIEELTLHLIDMKKGMEKQDKEIQDLKSKIK